MNKTYPSAWFVFGVLFLVYISWGSSYIGYKLSLEVAGPFLVAGGRSSLGGGLLLLLLLITGKFRRCSLGTLGYTAAMAVPMVLFGTGFLGLGQTQVSSAVAAVLTGSTPIVMILAGCLFAGEPRPAPLQSLGLFSGGCGIVFLGLMQQGSASGAHPLLGSLCVLFAVAGWVAGSLLMRRFPRKADVPALESTGLLLLIGGLECFVVGWLLGEQRELHWENLRLGVLVAFGWMAIGGSLIAYSCYVWLISHVPLALAVSYEYVVPVIGIFLGWYVGGEEISASIMLTCSVIIGSVFLVVMHRARN